MSVRLEIAAPDATRGYRFAEALFFGFLRVMALIFLALSLFVWAKAVGLWPGEAVRFDTMTNAQRVHIAVTAVLNPVTAVGLWTTMSWARAVWFMTIGFQTVSIMWYPQVIEYGGWIIIFHAASLLLYILFQILLALMRKEA